MMATGPWIKLALGSVAWLWPLRVRAITVGILAAALLPAGGLQQARAEDFFKGKTIRIVVGYGPGGGYDLYARVFAKHIGQFIPGNPTVIVQNMPGAGSFRAARYLYEAAPKDGTYLGVVSQTLALDAAMNPDPNFDATRIPYIGRISDSVDVGVAQPGATFKNFDDVRKRQISVGATGGSSPGFLMPAALARFGGAKFRIVSGYAGSAEAMLAMERGEVDLAASVALLTLQQKFPAWITDRSATILYMSGLKRSPVIPWVPGLAELGLDDEGRAVLRAIAAASEIGKSVITTPNIPAEPLSILRKALADMTSDQALAASLAKGFIPISGASGPEMDRITAEVAKTPRAILDRLKELIKP
ncbi:MAG: hypothetical protein IT536_10455 [Hyphomicrobiales bacterium]|nr:hypothetical protein [Hyphomicrobiales bacterium]